MELSPFSCKLFLFSGKSNLSATEGHTDRGGGWSLSPPLHGGSGQIISRTQGQLWTFWGSQASVYLDVFSPALNHLYCGFQLRLLRIFMHIFRFVRIFFIIKALWAWCGWGYPCCYWMQIFTAPWTVFLKKHLGFVLFHNFSCHNHKLQSLLLGF